ncbi:MAG: class I SAM-dependent methyltransferase [Cyanobacteria bacterium J06641_5]
MATILRTWSYKYLWLYNGISRLSALSVGGEGRFRSLALEGLSIEASTRVLDMCCGSGQTTAVLVERSQQVTGLDISPLSLERAAQRVPAATYVEALAEEMPFPDANFDLVHTSAALHEMDTTALRQIFQQVFRVLAPGGAFATIDLHRPQNPLFWPPLATFMWFFETQTAWQLLATDLVVELEATGFERISKTLHAGGSLQVLQAFKPIEQ